MPSDAKRERAVGIALVLGAAIAWSLGGLGIKRAHAEPLAIAGYRSLFALPIVTLAMLRRSRDDLGAIRISMARPALWLAAIGYASTVTLFVVATRLTTAANAILLQYTAPIYVALLSWPLLREPIGRRDLLASLGCFAGVAWFFGEKVSAQGAAGNVLALISGVGFGALPVMLRRIEMTEAPRVARVAPLMSLVVGNVIVAVVCAPWMLHGAGGASSLAILAGLGCFQIGLAYVLFAAGIRRVRALDGILLSMIEPILNPVWVAIGAGETPSSRAVVGGACILLSVAFHAALRPTAPAQSSSN